MWWKTYWHCRNKRSEYKQNIGMSYLVDGIWIAFFFWNQYVWYLNFCCWPKHCLCCSLWEKSCATRPGKVVVLSFPYWPFWNPFIFTVRIRCSPLFATLPWTMSIELFDSETAWKVACRCHDQVEHRIEARWGTKTWTVFSWGLPLPYKFYDSQQLLSLPGSAGFMKQLVQLTFTSISHQNVPNSSCFVWEVRVTSVSAILDACHLLASCLFSGSRPHQRQAVMTPKSPTFFFLES